MADIQPSGTSIAAPAAAAPIRDSSLEEGEGEDGGSRKCESVNEAAGSSVEKAVPHENGNADALQVGHDTSEANYHKGGDDGQTGANNADLSSLPASPMHSISGHNSANDTIDDATATSRGTTQLHTPPLTAQSSPDLGQTHTTTAQPQPHAPLKRFTSVNINKRFLEKTSSTSGTPSGANSLTGHSPGVSNASGSGQRRGASPSSRSPSTDRPASSRLVTAKLTAVPQPSAASTSGWLRASSSTPGNSAAPTPPSSSPQPPANESSTVPVAPASLQQPSKRRPGEPPAPNGMSASGSTSSLTQQQGTKPVWGKVVPTLPKDGLGRGAPGKEIQNDFPTAAEAAHGRKTKVLKAQLAAETAAAQTAAQKQAMIETAAAFRGAHLDANARHWDEMEDEDSDFLAGVIEFGDGTQYKIEHKAEAASSQDASSSLEPTKSPSADVAQPHPPVTKEERFGEDIGRSWPRARTSPVRPTISSSLPPRPPPLQHAGTHHSPTDGPASGSAHSPHDGTSPTSRVLFNERSNRLEPWSSTKPRLGPSQGPGPVIRRESREEHPLPTSQRQQPLSQPQGRDAPPHSHPSPPNVQLLQKGPPGSDSVWKGGAPRGFGHGSERGRWGDGPGSRGASSTKDEELPWELRRRESMSSSDAPGSSTRDRSRGRDSRWESGVILQGGEFDHDRGRRNSQAGQPTPILPSSLARDRSRDAGRQLPPHLSRMPPPPVPPLRGAPGRDMPPHTSHARPPIVSPAASVRSLLSPSSEQAPSIPVPVVPTSGDESVDKDALVKDAMQLAIERAKKRKQEGEAEEKRRLEAAERARRKAEALATAQEEKKKAEEPPPAEQNPQVLKPSAQETPQPPSKPNGLDIPDRRDRAKGGKQAEIALLNPTASRPASTAPHIRTVVPPPTLPRRPSIPPLPTPASQVDSWRSKATPVKSISPRPSQPLITPPARVSLPPTTTLPELDLSVKPDENIEIVDFCDLEKLMGPASSESPMTALEHAPASSSTRARRPVASDFFDDRPVEPRESVSLSKSDQPSWRRPLSKFAATSPPAAPGEELRTQTMPIFPADDAVPPKDPTSNSDSKPPLSPTTVSPPFKRHSSQGDQTSSSSTSQSTYVSPAVLAVRSPRTPSHFKEAPMSTLTDTMSRIKGALDGMQSQDLPPPREVNERSPERRASAAPTLAKAKANETSTGSWREQREPRPEVSPQVTRILSPPLVRPVAQEVFDVTRPSPPRSPKPAWNTFVVNLPKESRLRDAISRKQLHFWNLPHPGVRWDILSWDPPVEGMNKRELSRDEIFHRKNAVKGGKVRVLLPNRRIVHSPVTEPNLPQQTLNATSQHALITAAGVKIKLPQRTSSVRQNVVLPSHSVSFDRPRDSSVPSWRRSATPLTPLKKERQPTALVNGSPPDQLNTTSRSPPPEPSTPLPQFAKPKSGIPSRPPSAHSATVSLPIVLASDTRPSVSRRPSGPGVAFFRTSRSDPEADNTKPLPRFTVSSELDTGEPTDTTLVKHQNLVSLSDQSIHPAMAALPGYPPRQPPAETSLPRLVASKPESKSSDDSAPGIRPMTPPPSHPSSAWGKSPLSFSLKDSPARSAPDPEHLKAVWSQASERPVGSTSNSLRGIADDLPSIPFTVQDMKSEDGETPPPTAPAPPPSRLSLQEVTRAFQQVPGATTSSATSRPPTFAQTSLLSPGSAQMHRTNQPVAISLPPQHGVRPPFAPYPHSMVGHSPSPTLMYAPGIPSPVAHHRMAVSGPSPPIAHGMWLPTPPPPPSQPGSFMRPAGAPLPPTQMMYPPTGPASSPGAPGQLMHRRMSVVSPAIVPPPSAPGMYPGHPMDMQNHMHARSPHLAHTHPIGHPVPHMHVGHMFSPPQPGQAPAMYAVPVGAGRGGLIPRPGYEGYPTVPPHNASYQSVPSTSFVFQS